MAKSSKNQNQKEETAIEVIGAIFIAFAILFGLMWFLTSHKIVFYTTPFLRFVAIPWTLFDSGVWKNINEAYVYFREHPRNITIGYYFSYANTCLKPLAVLICAIFAGYLLMILFGKNKSVSLKRVLSPMDAAKEISKIFPSIIPVMHLGPKLIKNELAAWNRQTFPEDIWMHEKVEGKPLVEKNTLNIDRVSTYFRGGEKMGGKWQARGGRRWSKMLGYQVVDLLADSETYERICFPDRFSPQGKVIFALLCAHAFGGREGKSDYKKATDALNFTCEKQANGLPNLRVAQWLYDKYRTNEMAKKLFSVHHWEYSYLYTLFIKAKATGKATHTDFIWLKPLDRILFYTLNTVGRSTPPVEAAAVFAQVDYEVKTAKAGRLPLIQRADGKFEAHIAIGTAVEGFNTEFTRYQQCYDDNDDWWKELKTWSETNTQLKQTQNDMVAEKLRESMKVSADAISQAQIKEGSADMNAYELEAIEKAKMQQLKRDSVESKAILDDIGSLGLATSE